jgi:mannose-6-phosphate isomerase-like protein (cupin superfamily)
MSSSSNHLAIDIEASTIKNDDYRLVIYTGKFQLVLMSLKPGEDIPWEHHDESDQFIRVEAGLGQVELMMGTGVASIRGYELKDGTAVVIPAGTNHHIFNTGDEDLKLYTIYSSPEH